MPYYSLAYQPWHERLAIIVADFVRNFGRKRRETTALRSQDGLFHTQYRISAPTRRALDDAMADYVKSYPHFGYETRVLHPPRFYRGVWTATLKRANKC